MGLIALLAVVSATHFSARVDNPWFPLRPGTTYVYTGARDGKHARDVVTVTHRVRTTLGAGGRVVSTEGTWRSGRDGAKAGIVMFARPRVGRSARQEHYAGHAEDHFRVLDLHAFVKAPYVTSRNALLTKEWTPLEPGVLDHKLYVHGIGTVLEQTVAGGDERLALASVTHA